MEFSSKLLQSAVDEVAQLPGIGRRTALRLVLHLMRQPESQTLHLADALQKMRQNINFCKNCHNISDSELCEICINTNRQQDVVCVVEDIRDVMAIESTASYWLELVYFFSCSLFSVKRVLQKEVLMP